jgi:hypothetical protein
MTVKTKKRESGDVFIREDLSRDYDSESIVIDNTAGEEDMVLPAGTPFTDSTPTVAASISAFTGLLIKPTTVPAGEWACGAVFERGTGIVINGTHMPTVDIAAGASINMATFQTRAEALGFVWREEGEAVEEQTT